MSSYKVVARHKEESQQPSWLRGKPFTQAKKRVYVNYSDFLTYSPSLISRYEKNYDVEIYWFDELSGWVKLDKSGH